MSTPQIAELNFDDQGLEPIFIPVTYKGKHYVLTEATADVAVRFRNMSMKAAKWQADANGKPRSAVIDGMADTEPFLVSRCLFHAKLVKVEGEADRWVAPTLANGDLDRTKLVSDQVIRGWHPHVLKELFNLCYKISKLSEKEPENIAPRTIEQLDEEIQKTQALLDQLVLQREKQVAAEDGQENPDPNLTMDLSASSS